MIIKESLKCFLINKIICLKTNSSFCLKVVKLFKKTSHCPVIYLMGEEDPKTLARRRSHESCVLLWPQMGPLPPNDVEKSAQHAKEEEE